MKQPLPPFSVKLRELRLKRGLSQVAVATAAGVSAGYVGLIETGMRGDRPSEEVVKRLARALEASVDELEDLLRAAGWLGMHQSVIVSEQPTTPEIIEADPMLEAGDKMILLSLYQRMTRTSTVNGRHH